MLQSFTLKKSGQFSSAHHIPGHPKCGRVHGHTYHMDIEVSLLDVPAPLTLAPTSYFPTDDNMLMDFGDIKEWFTVYDHKNLNDIFPVPTAERIAQHIAFGVFKQFKERLEVSAGHIVVKVTLFENFPTASATVELRENLF